MATLAEFMPYILPLVSGCPQPLAEQTLRQVAIEFCMHAPIVQETLDPIDVNVGQLEYDIDTAFGTNVTIVLQALYNGLRMGAFRLGDAAHIDARYSDSGFYDAQAIAAPYRYRQSAGNSFTLDRMPTLAAPGAIVMVVATRPTYNANSLADVLLQDYGYEIGAGTAARLMLMPNQLFSAPQLAASYQSIYMQGRTNSRIRADASFGRASTRVQPRPFQ